MSLSTAGLIAVAISLTIFITIAIWHVGPWMRRQPIAVALTLPLWVHAFRYVALQTFAAQHFGYHISNALANEIVWGDVAGAGLALAALWLLRHGSRAALPVVWLFVVETLADLTYATIAGLLARLPDTAYAVTWLVVDIYLPLAWVALALTVWRLVAVPRTPA